MAEVTGLLLAAGFARRFGDRKLLAEVDGRPLIEHSIEALTPCDRVLAVVRDDDHDLQALLDALDVEWSANPKPQRGIGFSIACGVRATSNSVGWCILPADMPWVSSQTTQQLVDALHADIALAAPFYGAQRGHPVAFSSIFYNRLCKLDGDVGARHIVQQHAHELMAIVVDDAGVVKDVDYPGII